MASEELSAAERSELERLRVQNSGSGRWARTGRWVGACAILLVAALLGTLAVVAVYVRSEVLDTNTYVETVTPLAEDPAVQSAVAARLADELITRSDVAGLAEEAARQLEARGAPPRLSDLVSPLISGLRSFLTGRIQALLATERFQEAWINVNRLGHEQLITVLTGGQGEVVQSQGTTVTVDLGELLSLAKQQLVAEGFTIVSRVPDVSIPYTLVESAQLPKIRTYTRLLNAAGTWLPWVALALLLAGVLVAPNRRRGVIVGATMLGLTSALLLFFLNEARAYYLDRLPSTVRSPQAVAVVYDTITRFLIAALQTLVLAMVIIVIGALVAGPSRPAVLLRRGLNKGLDAASTALSRAGAWVMATSRALAAAYHPIQVAIVLIALIGLIIAVRPSIGAVLWVTVVVLFALALLEVFVRARSHQHATVDRRPLGTA
jgi:hypothetical protein